MKRIKRPLLSSYEKLSNEFMYVKKVEKNKTVISKDIGQLTAGSGLNAAWKCSNYLPELKKVCNHIWFSVIKDRAMKDQGCPSCSGNVVTWNNCLATHRPDLIKEWDKNLNSKTPSEVTKSSTYIATWNCAKCSHQWRAKVNDRFNNRGCPACAKKVATDTYSLKALFPGLTKEIHPDFNLQPEKMLPFSNRMVQWRCIACHQEWYAVVSSRTLQKSGCPHCSPNKSKHELRVYSELQYVFSDIKVESGARIDRIEADIFIPKIKLAVEYDGTYYHQDIQKDIKKNMFFLEKGYTLIRLRGEGLRKISKYDVITTNQYKVQKSDINNLLSSIASTIKLNNHQLKKISEYQQKSHFMNDGKYYKLIRNINIPKKENSLAVHKEIIDSWGSKNHRKPSHYALKSSKRIFLKCNANKNHEEWQVVASSLTRKNKNSVKINCPSCRRLNKKEKFYDNKLK